MYAHQTIKLYLYCAFLVISFSTYSFQSPQKSSQLLTENISTEQVTHWNHINNRDSSYSELLQPLSHYVLSINEGIQHPRFNMVLVKKLINWQQQHSNGLEFSLIKNNLTYKNLNSFNFNIKVNMQNSVIVSDIAALLIKNKWLEPQKKSLHKLLSTSPHFTLIFYGEHHNQPEKSTLYGAYALTLNNALDEDNYLHSINIKPENLSFYWQKNYQEQATTYNEVRNIAIQGAILVAESANTKVARNYTNGQLDNNFIEVFNELDIEISALTIQKSPFN